MWLVSRTIHYHDTPLTPGEVKEKMEEAIDDLDSRLKIDGIVIIRKKIDKGGDYSEVGNPILLFTFVLFFFWKESVTISKLSSFRYQAGSQWSQCWNHKVLGGYVLSLASNWYRLIPAGSRGSCTVFGVILGTHWTPSLLLLHQLGLVFYCEVFWCLYCWEGFISRIV